MLKTAPRDANRDGGYKARHCRAKALIAMDCHADAAFISYGDCIVPGNYFLHSLFSKARNYTNENLLVSLVTEEIGNGPANVVFRGIPGEKHGCLTIEKGALRLGSLCFTLQPRRKYISTIPPFTMDRDLFRRNLAHFSQMVVHESPPLSFAFLFDERRREHFTSTYERALLERVEEGWDLFRRGDYGKGTRFLKGTGYGFTPSGDDLIAGYLSGLYVVQRFFGEDVATIRNTIFSEGHAGNVVSDSFLHHAMLGRFIEKGKMLLIALLRGSAGNVKDRALKILTLGETSGADYSVGLIGALKNMGF